MCGFPAPGFPTGFISRHTGKHEDAHRGGEPRPFYRKLHRSIYDGSSSFASKALQKSGPFPPPTLLGFTSDMTLSDSRIRPPRQAWWRGSRPLARCGSSPLPGLPFQRALPTTPANQTGATIDSFPVRAAFPDIQAGRHPQLHFRGLLRLHSRYGPLDRSTAQGGLCHEASAPPVTR